MQVLSQTTTKILAPRPLKPIQHVSFQKLNSFITKEQFFAKGAFASSNSSNSSNSLNYFSSSSSNSNCSSKSSAFSEMIEDLSQIRRDSQNPQERDNTFQEQEVKELTMDKELLDLEAEIEEMLSFHH